MTDKYAMGGHVFMKRALQLSTFGGAMVSPNPFVGAVIVAEGKVIGEGYHREYGKAHAEVNAIASVREEDRHLLSRSTMYVTLEPCSHYGKTPPCAELIIRTGIPNVVVAAEDPFLKDKKSGIEMMRLAGINVEVGLLREEALWINRRFFTAHTLKRPYVLLKWAQSSDGFIAALPDSDSMVEGEQILPRPVKFSTPFTEMLMHRERSFYDAIMVGTNTVLTDRPRLNCRLWPCREADRRPLKVSFESPRVKQFPWQEYVLKRRDESLKNFLHRLYTDYGVTSLMVEGGAKTLESFISAGLYDETRVETSPMCLGGGLPAPVITRECGERREGDC